MTSSSNSNSNKKQKNLLDQQVALHSYLDDLLQGIPDTEDSQSVTVNEPEQGQNSASRNNAGLKNKHGLLRKREKQVQGQDVQMQARLRPDLYPVSNPGSKLEQKKEFRQEQQQDPQSVMDMPVLREFPQVEIPAPVVEVEEKSETVVEANKEVEVHKENKGNIQSGDENGAPDWAQERFKCLLFNVAGISLAVPLAKLNGVISWDGKVTPIPGHSRSFLGVMRHQGANVKVVDTAQIVLPEKQKEGILLPPEQRLKNVILVDNCNWGLACDGIGEVITLDQEEVRWRTSKGKLKWLAGTVLQHLCALLEVDAFTRVLKDGPE